MSKLILKYWFILLLAIFFLSGCTNEYAVNTKQYHAVVAQELRELGSKLDAKALTNTKLVDIYAKKLAIIKPDLKPVAESLAKDATRQGVLYQGLEERLKIINLEPKNKQEYAPQYQSLSSISSGADPAIFNDSLLDLINTMADLSGGQLERLSIPKDSETANVKGEAIVPGSYLVGNPGYGEYRQDSSGQSFWHWYGQYAFFTSLFSGPSYYNRPISYDNWNSRSRYSYYRDYGRDTYGSSEDRIRTQKYDTKMRTSGNTPAKPKKQYGSVQGRKRTSTYARQRTNNLANSKKKYGSNNTGPRHVDKTSAKRTSNYFSKSTNSSNTKPTKRTSSFFKSSNSSSRSSGSRSYSRGGK